MTSARDSNRTRNENNIEIERKLFQRIHALMLLKFVIKAKKEKDLSTLARLQNLLLVNELLRGGYAVGYKSGFSLLLKCCDNIKLIENYEKTSQSIIFKAALQPWRIPEKKWITKEMGTFFGRAKLFQMYEDQGIPVFVKLTRAYDNEDSFIEIEGKIGIHIINKMVRDRTTPHMMSMLAVEHSNNVPGDVDQLIRTEQTHTNIGVLKAPVKHLFTPESYSNYDINLTDSARMRHLEKLAKRGTLLMAECGNGTEFRYWVKKHGLNNTLLFPIIGGVAIIVALIVAGLIDILMSYVSNVLFKVKAEYNADIFAAQMSSMQENEAAAEFIEKHDSIIRENPEPTVLAKLPSEILSGHPNAKSRVSYLRDLAFKKSYSNH